RAVDAGGAGVLELLFGAEEGVEHRLTRVLAQHQRDRARDDGEEDEAAEAAALALAPAAQLLGGLAQALGGLAQVALDLAVAGHGLDRPLAVPGGAPVGAAGCFERPAKVVAQLV